MAKLCVRVVGENMELISCVFFLIDGISRLLIMAVFYQTRFYVGEKKRESVGESK